jgi:outer membrane protein OmpA-like peptidoglycan-associated protein
LPGSYPPIGGESVDAEGNRIQLAPRTGRWHLVAAPGFLPYTPAAGYKPELLPMNPAASYLALKARCEAIAQEQLANAQKLKGDMKYYFAKVYHYVTLNELKAIEAGTYQYPHMKMQEIILFHTAYQQSLDAWQAGQKDKVEVNWRQAFSEAEEMNDGSWIRFKSQEISKALLPSMEAHIRFDLPRAIATAYDLYYSGIPGTSMGDFRADFNNMGPVFERATADMTPEIEEDPYFFDPGDWGWMRDALFPFFFHIGLERDMAWEKAGLISRMSGRDLKSLDRTMRATMTAAHPNLEPFEIGGDEMKGYDWKNQPGAPTSVPGPQPTFEQAPPAPSIPARLYFRLDLPTGGESLEQSVRSDQDLRPLLALAEWTREVRDAEIGLVGHASADGPEVDNNNLGGARASLIEFFLFRAGADLDHNRVITSSQGETGAKTGPEWRFVELSLRGRALAKRQVWGPTIGVPAEAAPR